MSYWFYLYHHGYLGHVQHLHTPFSDTPLFQKQRGQFGKAPFAFLPEPGSISGVLSWSDGSRSVTDQTDQVPSPDADAVVLLVGIIVPNMVLRNSFHNCLVVESSLRKMMEFVGWDYFSQDMEQNKQRSKPPTR